LAALDANLAALGLAESSRVVRSDVRSAIARLARERERFALILMDPPYGSEEGLAALHGVALGNLLAPEGTLGLETAWRPALGVVPGLERADERRYGETLVICFQPQRAGAMPEPARAAQRAEGEEPGE